MNSIDRRPEIVICRDASALAVEAARRIVATAQTSVAARNRFNLVLSGGSTPERTYSLLAQPERRSQIEWQKTWLMFGDERCVPHDDLRSNYRLAAKSLFEPAHIASEQILPVPSDLGSPALCAAAYEATLRTFFHQPPSTGPFGDDSSGGFPQFDMVLLGLGDDGHTASLFPGMPALREANAWVTWSPPGVLPPPVDRVTLTFPAINAAREVMFLVAGAGKAAVVREILEGSTEVNVYPSSGVHPKNGKLIWLLDEAAAALLNKR
ncbi:MAG TPA: 6-phosphogluconolactonase, partial [Pirellulales bacterium]